MATKKTDAKKEDIKVDVQVNGTEVAEPEVTEDDRVWVMIPPIEGEPPEVTVWVNDEITQIKKGYRVPVKPNVAEVLENSYQMNIVAMENKKALKNQHQDW